METLQYQENRINNKFVGNTIENNKDLWNMIEDIENPENIAEQLSNFIDNTRKDYDEYK